jgi:hypothetical protein
MLFVQVRALLSLLQHLHTSRSIMACRGLAAAYASDAALGVLVTGLLLANDQRFDEQCVERADAKSKANAGERRAPSTVSKIAGQLHTLPRFCSRRTTLPG